MEVGLPITLGQFVKLAGLASTGGEAKLLVAGGHVRVNGQIETRRGRKLAWGDLVETRGESVLVGSRQGDDVEQDAAGDDGCRGSSAGVRAGDESGGRD